MRKPHFVLAILALTSLLIGCASNAATQSNEAILTSAPEKVQSTASLEVMSKDPPTDCPITVPPKSQFIPPLKPHLPQAPFQNEFWFGTNHLWTSLPANGVWLGLPKNSEGYTQKIFWWSDLFSLDDEPEPALVVSGQRLDAEAPLFNISKATNAFAGDIGWAMLTGVDFPTLGCWQITGQYKKSEFSFVVWVAP